MNNLSAELVSQLKKCDLLNYVDINKSTNERLVIEVYENSRADPTRSSGWVSTRGPPLDVHKFTTEKSTSGFPSRNVIPLCPGFYWEDYWEMDMELGYVYSTAFDRPFTPLDNSHCKTSGFGSGGLLPRLCRRRMFTRVQVRNKHGVQHVPYTLELNILGSNNIPPSSSAVFKYLPRPSNRSGVDPVDVTEILIGQVPHLDSYDVRQGKVVIEKDFLCLPPGNSEDDENVIEIQCCARDEGLGRELVCAVRVYPPGHKMYKSGKGYAEYKLLPRTQAPAQSSAVGFFKDKFTSKASPAPSSSVPTLSISTEIIMNDVVKLCHDISFSPVCVTDPLPADCFIKGFPPVVKKYLEYSYERGLLQDDEVEYVATDVTNMMFVLGGFNTWEKASGAGVHTLLNYPPARMDRDAEVVLFPPAVVATVQTARDPAHQWQSQQALGLGVGTLYSATLCCEIPAESGPNGQSRFSSSSVQVRFTDEYRFISWMVHLRKTARRLQMGLTGECADCPEYHEAMVKITSTGAGPGKLRRQQSNVSDEYIPARCSISAASRSMMWIADPPNSKQLQMEFNTLIDHKFDVQCFPPAADFMLPVKLKRFLNFMLPKAVASTTPTKGVAAAPDEPVQILQIFRVPSKEAAIVLTIPGSLTNKTSVSIPEDDLPEAALFLSKADLELPPASVKYIFKVYSYFRSGADKTAVPGSLGVAEATVNLSSLVQTLPAGAGIVVPEDDEAASAIIDNAPARAVEKVDFKPAATSFVVNVGRAEGLLSTKPGASADVYCKIYLMDKAGVVVPINSTNYFAGGNGKGMRSALHLGSSQTIGENGSLRTPAVSSKNHCPVWDFTSNALPLVVFGKDTKDVKESAPRAGAAAKTAASATQTIGGLRTRVVTQLLVVLFDKSGMIKKDMVIGEVIIPLIDALGGGGADKGVRRYAIGPSSRMPDEFKTHLLGNITIGVTPIDPGAGMKIPPPSVAASLEVKATSLVTISSRNCRWPCRMIAPPTPADPDEQSLYYLDIARYDAITLTASSDVVSPTDKLAGCQEEQRVDDDEKPCRRHLRIPLSAVLTEGSLSNNDCDCSNITELTSSCLVISFVYHRKFAGEGKKTVYHEVKGELLVGPCAAAELRKSLISRYRMGKLRTAVVEVCQLKTEEDGLRDGNNADYPIAERNCSKEAMEVLKQVVSEVQVVMRHSMDRKADYQTVYMNSYLRLLIYWYSRENPDNLSIIQSEFRAALKEIVDRSKNTISSSAIKTLVGEIKDLAEATVLSLMLHSDSVPSRCAHDITTDDGISLGYRIIDFVHYVIENCYRTVVSLITNFTRGSSNLHAAGKGKAGKKDSLAATQAAADMGVATDSKKHEARTEQATRDLLNFLISRDDWLGQLPGEDDGQLNINDSNICVVASVLRSCGLVLNRKPLLSLCIDYNGMMVQFSQLLAKDVAYWSGRTTDQILREGAKMGDHSTAGAKNAGKLDLPWLFDEFGDVFMSHIPIDIQMFFQMQIQLRQLPNADINQSTVLKIRVLNSQIAAAIYRAYLNLAKWYLRHLGTWKKWDQVDSSPAHDGDLKFLVSVVNDAQVIAREHLPECMSQLRLQGELGLSARSISVNSSSMYDFSQSVDAFRKVGSCAVEIIAIVLLTRYASSDYDFDSQSFHSEWFGAIVRKREGKLRLLVEQRKREGREMDAELEALFAEPAEEAEPEEEDAARVAKAQEAELTKLLEKVSITNSSCRQLVIKKVLEAMREDIENVAELVNENLFEQFLEKIADKFSARYLVLIQAVASAVGDITSRSHGIFEAGVLKVAHGVGQGVTIVANGVGHGVSKVAQGVGQGVGKVTEGVGKVTTVIDDALLGGHLKGVGGVLKGGVSKMAEGVDSLNMGGHIKGMLHSDSMAFAQRGDDLHWEHDDIFSSVFGVETLPLLLVEQIIADIITIEEFFNGLSKRMRVFSDVFNQLHTIGVALQEGMVLRRRANNLTVDHMAAALGEACTFSDSDDSDGGDNDRDSDDDGDSDDDSDDDSGGNKRSSDQESTVTDTVHGSMVSREGKLVNTVGANSAGIREALYQILLDSGCDLALTSICRLCGIRTSTAAGSMVADLENVVDVIFHTDGARSKRSSVSLAQSSSSSAAHGSEHEAPDRFANSIPPTFPSDEAMLKVCGLTCSDEALFAYSGMSDDMSPVSYKVSLSDINISGGMKAAKSKKLYLLASIIDESAVKTAPRTDENSVLFPIRYYEDKLRWDDKRVLQTQSLSGKVLNIQVLERHYVDNALGLISKNVIDGVRHHGKSDPRLTVEDSARAYDTLVAAVTISLQGIELYEKAGVHGWYPLQISDEAVGLAAVHKKMARRGDRIRNSVVAGVTGIGETLFKAGGGRVSMTEGDRFVAAPRAARGASLPPGLEEEATDKGVIEYSAISADVFADMVADGSVADAPHIDILITAQQV